MTNYYWQGEKVELRALELSDADFFFKLNQDTERSKFVDWLKPLVSREAIEDWLQEKTKQTIENYDYQWMIDSNDGQIVGSIVTHSCNSRVGTFSYALDIAQEFQRQGFASEAIKLILKYYFQELRFQKVTVAVHSNNLASLELHKHLGFKHEGTHRRMVYNGGKFYDLEWFGLIFEEYLDEYLHS